jgi:hypothetical protein
LGYLKDQQDQNHQFLSPRVVGSIILKSLEWNFRHVTYYSNRNQFDSFYIFNMEERSGYNHPIEGV